MIIIKRIRIKDCNVQLADANGKERLRDILKRHLGGTVDFEYDEMDGRKSTESTETKQGTELSGIKQN